MSEALPNLNRKLVLETVVRVPDGGGGFSETWTPLGSVWAEVKAGVGKEALEGMIATSSVRYRIIVRSAPPGSLRRPSSEQRFREGDRLFPILAVADAGVNGRYLTCFTREEVGSA